MISSRQNRFKPFFPALSFSNNFSRNWNLKCDSLKLFAIFVVTVAIIVVTLKKEFNVAISIKYAIKHKEFEAMIVFLFCFYAYFIFL